MKFKKPTVLNNGMGGILYNLLEPKEPHRIYGIKIKQENKEAYLSGDLDVMLELSSELDNRAGYELPGKIVTKEFLHPINSEDEMRYLKIKNGKFCKKNGQYIWSITEYTHDINEIDQIIEEDE